MIFLIGAGHPNQGQGRERQKHFLIPAQVGPDAQAIASPPWLTAAPTTSAREMAAARNKRRRHDPVARIWSVAAGFSLRRDVRRLKSAATDRSASTGLRIRFSPRNR